MRVTYRRGTEPPAFGELSEPSNDVAFLTTCQSSGSSVALRVSDPDWRTLRTGGVVRTTSYVHTENFLVVGSKE